LLSGGTRPLLRACSLRASYWCLQYEKTENGATFSPNYFMQPRGVSFSFTLVVSFHPVSVIPLIDEDFKDEKFFVVGIDRAFHIQCFFLESVKSLNAGFDVG
uniref:CNH domain-containing protein n=1 Tax=Angiostrongylus cantonensis TaxID=6313 RepID=A0A0K0DGL9_ANGCA